MTDSNNEEGSLRSTGPVSFVGLLLVPVAAILLLFEVGRCAYWLWYVLSQSGISSRRRADESIVSLVVGLVGPISVVFIWLDLLKTGMTKRSRMALIGYLRCAIAGVAVITFLASPDQFS
jgi:hypothetical protein